VPERTRVPEPFLLVLGLAATIAGAIVARRLALPAPIVFVLGGTLLAFVPGLPPIRIAPDWIFLAVLPPLLFSAGWATDWKLFRANLRPILLLAVGLVIVSTVIVAAVAQRILPELGWAAAFVLGAVVSPPDAVAAGALFERFSIPRRIVAVVEGEGMVNDATALVIYGYAVAAVTTGAFSLPAAAVSFVFIAAGGVAVGIGVTWLTVKVTMLLNRYELNDATIQNVLLIAAPYVAYLTGQALHVSAVLATVVAGIALARRSVYLTPEARLIGINVWTLWIYLLNAFLFLAIGLQVRTIVRDDPHALALLPPALAISAVLIVVRLLWVFPAAWLPRQIPAIARRDPLPPWSYITIIGWSGMRGIVSLAAALALPLTTATGAPFPGRDAIAVVTFVVILVTLVGQGLTLIPILQWLHVREEGDTAARDIAARVAALEEGLAELRKLDAAAADAQQHEIVQRQIDEYVHRIEHLRGHEGHKEPAESSASKFDHDVQWKALQAERRKIATLRDAGKIPDEVFRTIQYDLDLAESRLV
jgi:CPA1 family monovalent cation:H+ antiporter